MGIISMVATVPTLLSVLTASNAALADNTNTNETKTNFEISESVKTENGVFVSEQKAPYNYDGYETVKSEDEAKREKVYAKYEEKRKNANLPEGKFTINASAYTAAADECGKSDGITASGLKVKENRTIACPPAFPFGTKLKIDGMGTYICEDRGGAIKGNHIDIYMETKKEAFAFGRKNLTAEIEI